jgi:hypothetical protein
MIATVEQASRIQIALLPPGDAPIGPNGAPERWRPTSDPVVLVERQEHLDHVADVLRADALNNGDIRLAELRAFVRGVAVEIAFTHQETTT